MGIESSVNGIDDFNTAWPLNSETLSGTDDHLRLIKEGIKGTFAELASTGGVVNADATELNYSQGITSAVQTQLDAFSFEPNWTRLNLGAIISSRRLFYPTINTKNLIIGTNDGGTIEVYLPTTVGAIQGDFVEFTLAFPIETGVRPGSFGVYPATGTLLKRSGVTGAWTPASSAGFNVVSTNPVIRCAFDAVESKWRVWRVDHWL